MKRQSSRNVVFSFGVICVALASVAFLGCRGHMPHSATWPATGDTQRTHPKPPEGGYYTNWDPYAATLEVEPTEDVNPVKTQHILVATIRDHEGKPLPNRRVEWIISEGSVGDFVEVDESGWRASRGYKVTNHFAVTHTNNFAHVLDRGTDDPTDDIDLTEGQTWVVITSPIEGDTHVTAYAPGIYDWDKHKVFVIKHWYDVAWEWPEPAVNRIGTPHLLTTRVMKISDGMPLPGYIVTYKLLGGPAGTFDGNQAPVVATETDQAGLSAVTLEQIKPVAGQNDIQIDIIRPDDVQCCRPGAHIATGATSKVWIAPSIGIVKQAPARGELGETFQYNITVSNPSEVEAQDVIVTDALPLGIQYVGATPQANVHGQSMSWSLGALEPGARAQIEATVKATQTGTFTNCAEVTASDGLYARDCANTIITAPQLALEMQCISEAILCDEMPYRVVVRNVGDGSARNVVVNVTLPDGLATVDGRNVATFKVGTLAPGQARELTFGAKPSSTGLYVAQAAATADGGLFAESECQSEIFLPILTVTKTGPEKRYIGRPATYEITVSNEGDVEARDTRVVDTLASGAKFLSASHEGRLSGQQVTWGLGNLAPGASKTVTLSVQSSHQGPLLNTVVAKAYCAEAEDSMTTLVEGIPAILLEVIDIDDPIEVGSNSTYEIVVTNQGSAVGTNIVITCMLPPAEEYVSATGPTGASVSGNTISFAPLPSLPPMGRASYRVVIKGVAPGDVRFKTTLTTDQMQVPVEETESTHIY